MSECQYLVDYYDAAGGPAWGAYSDWFSNALPCAWSGVTCDGAPHIIRLEVEDENQVGVIARGIDRLPFLDRLTIAGKPSNASSFIRGFLPPELGKLNQLSRLHIRYNRIVGSIPVELGDLSNLQSLMLNSNGLSGSIPKELGNLSALTHLYLYSNQLIGNVPGQLAMPSLVDLRVHANEPHRSYSSGNRRLDQPAKVVSLAQRTRWVGSGRDR